MASSSSPTTIAIIGAAGVVGSSIAYSLILNPIASQIILSDPQTEVVEAQAADLRDAVLQSETTSTRIHVARDAREAGQADIIIISAGAAQKQGESRTDLVGKNAKILKSVVENLGGTSSSSPSSSSMMMMKKEAIVLIVANPVDVMTLIAQKLFDLPPQQVFGSGTFLDSARLKGKIAEQVGVSQENVEAFVLGEHGESQVVAWSAVSVAGVALDRILITEEKKKSFNREEIAAATRDKAGAIIDGKGTTNYGIGSVTASICKAILFDQKVIRGVSHWIPDLGVCLSMPAVIGKGGIMQTISLQLSDEENKKIQESAQSLKEVNSEAQKALEG